MWITSRSVDWCIKDLQSLWPVPPLLLREGRELGGALVVVAIAVKEAGSGGQREWSGRGGGGGPRPGAVWAAQAWFAFARLLLYEEEENLAGGVLRSRSGRAWLAPFSPATANADSLCKKKRAS